jgi:glycosyltransferase involved in cell wall biosynthesis
MTLLTIAIPTHNRLPYLKELLPELLKQCEPYPEIEILISDNCTTDGTLEYITDMASHNPHMRYRRNPVNTGGEENQVQCVEAASGRYIWIFPDDELLCPFGIQKVMTTLKKHPVDLVIVGQIGSEPGDWYGTYSEFIHGNKPQVVINQAFLICNIFKKCFFNTTVARDKHLSVFGYNYGRFTLSYALADNLLSHGTVYHLNTKIYHVRSERAAPSVQQRYIRLKYIELLLYLGLSCSTIISFILNDLILRSIVRQIYKVRVSISDSEEV